MNRQDQNPSDSSPRLDSSSSKSEDEQLNFTRTDSQAASPAPTSKELTPTQEIKLDPQEEPELSKWSTLPEYKVGGKRLEGKGLNYGIAFISALSFLMFGYDQGVLSSLLTLDSFQRSLPLMTPNTLGNPLCQEGICQGSPEIQAAAVAIYQVGCFLGSIGVLFYGDGWGRRSSTFWGSLVMIIGTAFQAGAAGDSSTSYALFVVGRVIGGLGNGVVTSSIPTYQAECAKSHQRGLLIMLSGTCIAAGIMISYWVDYGFFFLDGEVRWRFPIAFQAFFTIVVMIGLLWLPDSPRWLLLRGRKYQALDVIARLFGKEKNDPEVVQELHSIEEALRVQNTGKFDIKELMQQGPAQHRHRTILACLAQFFQQIGGINAATYFVVILFEDSLGFGPAMSRLLAGANGTEYFLASIVALPLIERVGRRKLMIVGGLIMSISMAIVAGTVSTGIQDSGGNIILDDGPGITGAVFLFVFNTGFAIGFLGMTWLYPAEVTPLRIRIQANALSTSVNWITNFLIVMIVPPALANIGYQLYVIFAIFNAAIVPCIYFFFPETKGRSLEELDIIFANSYEQKSSIVKEARETPKLYSEEIEAELARLFPDSYSEGSRLKSDSNQESGNNNARFATGQVELERKL